MANLLPSSAPGNNRISNTFTEILNMRSKNRTRTLSCIALLLPSVSLLSTYHREPTLSSWLSHLYVLAGDGGFGHPIFSFMMSKAFACRRRLCYTIVLVCNSVHAAHFLIYPVCKRRVSCSRLTISVYGDVHSTVKESWAADCRNSRSHTMASDNHLVIRMTAFCLTNGAFDHLFDRSPLFCSYPS